MSETKLKFTKKHEHNQVVFYDQHGEKYKALHCRMRGKLTPHLHITTSDDMAIFECVNCGRQQSIFMGIKGSPERKTTRHILETYLPKKHFIESKEVRTEK